MNNIRLIINNFHFILFKKKSHSNGWRVCKFIPILFLQSMVTIYTYKQKITQFSCTKTIFMCEPHIEVE